MQRQGVRKYPSASVATLQKKPSRHIGMLRAIIARKLQVATQRASRSREQTVSMREAFAQIERLFSNSAGDSGSLCKFPAPTISRNSVAFKSPPATASEGKNNEIFRIACRI
ncbi:MAG: hypothetical protein DBX55_07500 [Verrucomicrobia bacterium]|nr:MAG: hypothetical protein DBX55_07500 [Verrucomicrobiota bacterium]